MTDLLDLMGGRHLANQGMERAIDHANAVNAGWGDAAFAKLAEYARWTPFFTVEQMRAWAYSQGLPRPPNECSWGAVTTRARKSGVMTLGDYATAENASRHCGINRKWRSLIYRGGS
jgi:hypothetical protein